jgi:glycosyltransferase involved in cell wall biosynthesis
MADRPGARLRIALVLGTSTGGVGRHVRGLARCLAERAHTVEVLGPAATDQEFAFAKGLSDDAVRFRPVEIASGLPAFGTLKAALRLRRLTRNTDVVHAHGVRAAAVAVLGVAGFSSRRRRHRRPALVITFHNAILGSTALRSVLRLGMRLLARAADAVLVVSDDLAAELRSATTDVRRAVVCADLPAFSVDPALVRSQLGVTGETPLVLAIGRLHTQKGFDVLIDAAALLGRTVAGAVVVVAGEGPQRTHLEQQIASTGAHVRLLGHRADTADLMRAADVVVMPSRWEGWPLAAAEVLAAGRPFIATTVGGLPELVGDAAVLVPPGSAQVLAEAIARVLSDAAFAGELAERAQRRALELPTSEDVAAQVLACYQGVSAGRQPVTQAVQ